MIPRRGDLDRRTKTGAASQPPMPRPWRRRKRAYSRTDSQRQGRVITRTLWGLNSSNALLQLPCKPDSPHRHTRSRANHNRRATTDAQTADHTGHSLQPESHSQRPAQANRRHSQRDRQTPRASARHSQQARRLPYARARFQQNAPAPTRTNTRSCPRESERTHTHANQYAPAPARTKARPRLREPSHARTHANQYAPAPAHVGTPSGVMTSAGSRAQNFFRCEGIFLTSPGPRLKKRRGQKTERRIIRR